ncbi:PREDICTED: protein BOLA1, chloroplastic [Tarenaya hassleriana]|uniref:protein BOLA1, chloroplastic n=1 Tax=Tarenaya hassleriana TaxID=28532 RepID=UPI00053C83B3|nr:PREDICTED: protein BOLA1, chloroplastic [Tarenaya hassleriana]XP_010542499.1 PREDICTED: protein BOLA1, chloroplastic [Tarenaya hassleriana]XP_010542500.1 PREDICTED: protein BOLA1, chloroplastic [Tarenaya hassleriana]
MFSSSFRLIALRFHRTRTLISPGNPPRYFASIPRSFSGHIDQQEIVGLSSESGPNPNGSSRSRIGMSSGDRTGSGPGDSGSRATRIRERLQKELDPSDLLIEDVSYQHAGHAGVRGRTDGETHFNVKIVCEGFEGMNLVKRHRMVYDLLRDELESGLHALSIVAKTPSESDR